MRKIATIIVCFLCCQLWAQGELCSDVEIEDISTSINFGHSNDARPDSTIDIIVIHSNYYLGNDPHDIEGCISQFRRYHVAPHYLITREGKILRMVDESHTCFHAGESRLPGTRRTSLNKNSIGIEIINTNTEPPTDKQYAALLALTQDICVRRDIRYIVRHSDIASDRKDDPWMFDWEWFKEEMNFFLPELNLP